MSVSDDSFLPSGDEAAPQDTGVAWLRAFWAVRAENLEAFRQRFCPQCQRHALLLAPQRMDACQARNCGLRDPDLFATEQGYSQELAVALVGGLSEPTAPQVDTEAVEELHRAIVAFRCLVPGGMVRDGRLYPGYDALNLRGRVHGALLRMVYHASGVRFYNAFEPGAAEKAREDIRDFLRNRDGVMRNNAVYEAHDADPARSYREIERLTGVDHSVVGKLIRKREKLAKPVPPMRNARGTD